MGAATSACAAAGAFGLILQSCSSAVLHEILGVVRGSKIKNKIVLLAYLFCLCGSATSANAVSSVPDEENSLALQMARRMIIMNQNRPLPSRAYQQSVEMVRRQNAKRVSETVRPSKKIKNSPSV